MRWSHKEFSKHKDYNETSQALSGTHRGRNLDLKIFLYGHILGFKWNFIHDYVTNENLIMFEIQSKVD